MATTNTERESQLVPKPVTVSSTSSIDTNASSPYITATELTDNAVVPIHPASTEIVASSVGQATGAIEHSSAYYGGAAVPAPSSVVHPADTVPSSVSLVSRPTNHLHITPSPNVVVPATMPTTNTVPEFLYQLTKMLTDNNREIIEWSNGKRQVA